MADEVLLARDVLDKLIVDRRRHVLGRADGIVLSVRRDKPPRVVALELGTTTLWERVSPRLASWIGALERWAGVHDGKPVRIPFAVVTPKHDELRADVDGDELGAFVWEQWWRRHLVERLPWSGSK